MYLYEIYDFGYEFSTSFYLYHNTKFTEKEFEDIVNDCIGKLKIKIKENAKRIESEDFENEELSEEELIELENLSLESDLFNNLEKYLVKDYGFIKLEPIHKFVHHTNNEQELNRTRF